jgi:hypothetical protein
VLLTRAFTDPAVTLMPWAGGAARATAAGEHFPV